MTYVYFAQIGTEGPIKIGFTGDHPKVRIRSLQHSCPWPIRLLGYGEGDEAEESALHKRLAAHRLEREWFNPHADVLRAIDDVLGNGFPCPSEAGAGMWFADILPLLRDRVPPRRLIPGWCGMNTNPSQAPALVAPGTGRVARSGPFYSD